MIKRVERFTTYARDGMKPNRTVRYYLFGFILIYESETRCVNLISELNSDENIRGKKGDSSFPPIPPLSRRLISEEKGQEAV